MFVPWNFTHLVFSSLAAGFVLRRMLVQWNFTNLVKLFYYCQIHFKSDACSVKFYLKLELQSHLPELRYMQYWLFQLSPLPSPNFQNFESVWARPKFCSKLLKWPKAEFKVNEMQWKWMKSKYFTVKFC